MDATPPTEPAPSRRRRISVATAVAAAILVTGGLVAGLTQGGNSKKSSPTGAASGTDIPGSSGGLSTISSTAATRPTSTGGGASTASGNGTSGTGSSPGGRSSATAPGSRTVSTTPGTLPQQQHPPTTLTTVPPALIDAYEQGYTDECRSIWSIAGPDGVLIDTQDPDERPFLVSDCIGLMDSVWAEPFLDEVNDARAQGKEDAIWNLDDEMIGRKFRNTAGTKTWTSPLSG